jgi:hypothetical protein
VDTRIWLNRTQPQTLQIATIIMYINAVFALLDQLFLDFPIGTVFFLGSIAAGLGIANEKKAGYWVAVGVAFLPLVLLITGRTSATLINLLFEIALVALLLHPMSRDYRRTWFR